MGKGEGARDLETLLEYMRDNRGFDFTGYKRPSLDRRIRKRMADARIKTLRQYRDYLDAHPEEFALLFNTILINVTAFFRDPPAWDFLRAEIIPKILAAGQAGAGHPRVEPRLRLRRGAVHARDGAGRGAGRGGIPPPRQNLRHGHGPGSPPRGAARDLRREGRRRRSRRRCSKNISSRRAIPTPSGPTCATRSSSAGTTCATTRPSRTWT